MTGCGGVKVVSPEAGSSSQKAEFEKIKTPEDEKVVLNIVDWSDSTKDAREKLNEQFMKDHPNVTVNYTTLTQGQEMLRTYFHYRLRLRFPRQSVRDGFFR